MITGRDNQSDANSSSQSCREDDGLIVNVKNMQITFPSSRGPVHAVQDFNLSLPRGSTLGVVGESGSGKSVMARALMGLTPSAARVTADRLVVAGTDVLNVNREHLRKLRGGQVAMVFQDPMRSLNPTMKIGTQVAEMMLAHTDMSKATARKNVVQLLDNVRIPAAAQRAQSYPHQLSGGMRQRVMIAIALAANPNLLIADEPTTALDVTVQAQILDLMAELQRDLGMSLILVTHDLAVASSYTENLAVMYAGRILEKGRTRQVLSDMHVPYTRGLFDSIPRIDAEPHSNLRAIPGTPPDPTKVLAGCPFENRCSHSSAECLQSHPVWDSDGDGHEWWCWNPITEGPEYENSTV